MSGMKLTDDGDLLTPCHLVDSLAGCGEDAVAWSI